MSKAILRHYGRRHRGEEGYALATVVALTFILITTVTAVFTIELANIEGTRRAGGQLEGRAQAESSVDAVFANVVSSLRSSPAPGANILPNDVNGTQLEEKDSAGKWIWYEDAGGGKFQLCADVKKTCVHFAVVSSGSRDYTIEVTTRTRCLGASFAAPNTNGQLQAGKCIVTKYQQRIRRKQYFDYLRFTLSEQLGLGFRTASTDSVPYTGLGVRQDVVNGPIRTDGQFAVCSDGKATPVFKDIVEQGTGNGFADAGCTSTSASNGSTSVTPQTVSKLGPPQANGLDALCATAQAGGDTYDGSSGQPVGSGGCGKNTKGYVYIKLDAKAEGDSADGYEVCVESSPVASCFPKSHAYPANGVIYVDAKAVLVYGTLAKDQKLTIATNGDIYIRGDLKYQTYQARNGQTQPSVSGNEALGMIAGGGVGVLCANARSASAPLVDAVGATANDVGAQTCALDKDGVAQPKLIVNAAILAVGNSSLTGQPSGTIYAENWATSGPGTGGALPTLEFYGSMASKTRGPFGAYTSTGDYAAGFIKDFTFDKRLRDVQPPYFLEPTNAQWERVDLTEVPPCAPGLNGVNPSSQGAGC